MLRNNLKNFVKKATILLAVVVVFLFAKEVLAQQDLGVNKLADAGLQLGQLDIRTIVARIIQVFLGILGTLAVVLILYGGFVWMTAAGDPMKITKAKKILINGIIGLLIILSAYSIAYFIIRALTGVGAGVGVGAGPSSYSQPLSGSLGAGIISHHVPERDGTAPRNTKIAITFKEVIDEKSLVQDTDGSGTYGDNNDEINKKVFKMVQTSILKKNNNNFKNVDDKDLVVLIVKFTPDKKSFVFKPIEYLGSPTENISYTIFITPELKKADGNDAFAGGFRDGYRWEFQVEPKLDTTPPQLVSVIPSKGIQPRNTIVQLNFSEAIDPTSASGDYTAGSGFQNITLKVGANIVEGSYRIANAYRTVEFLTDDLCGTNSCGGDVYCLPSTSLINGLIKAATVGSEPPQAAGFPYGGIVDMAGNSFDGNSDGTASGPTSQSGKPAYKWVNGRSATQGDDVTWQFNTSDKIDLVPPKINSINPGLNASYVGLTTPIEIIFSKIMSVFSLNNSNLGISHDIPEKEGYELWYGIWSEALDSAGKPVIASTDPINTKAIIKHGSFAPSELPPAQQYNYFPIVLSEVQDLRQNCYNPSAGPQCTPTAAAPFCCNGQPSAVKNCGYLP